jgi:hypothetical protein
MKFRFPFLKVFPESGRKEAKRFSGISGSIENIMNSDSYTISEKASLPLKVAESCNQLPER